MFITTAPTPLRSRPATAVAKPPAPAGSAQALADDAPRQGEDRAREHVEADERAELRVPEPEVGHHEGSDRGDRLELEAHRRAGQEDERQHDPAVGHARA
jgi:hypothetical protein